MADQAYKSFELKFGSKGLAARIVNDLVPPEMYQNLLNAELRQEGCLASRLGVVPITADGITAGSTALPLPAAAHTLARLKSLNDSSGNPQTYRYAGAGNALYRRAGDQPGEYTVLHGQVPGWSALLGAGGGGFPRPTPPPHHLFSARRFALTMPADVMSGTPFSTAEYRPNMSSVPYIFFADSGAMLKDNGTLAVAQPWGVFPPPLAAKADLYASTVVDLCQINKWSNPVPATLAALTATGLTLSIATDPSFSVTTASIVAGSGTPEDIILPSVTDIHVGDTLYLSGGMDIAGVAVPGFEKITVTRVTVGTNTISAVFAQYRAAPFNVQTPYPAALNTNADGGGKLQSIALNQGGNLYAGQIISTAALDYGYVEDIQVITDGDRLLSARFPVAYPSQSSIYPRNYLKAVANGVTAMSISRVMAADLSATPMLNLILNYAASSTPPQGVDQPMANESVTIQFSVGDSSFTNYYSKTLTYDPAKNTYSVSLKDFLPYGVAGTTGHTLANVQAWTITFGVNPAYPAYEEINIFNFYAGTFASPDSTGGSPYDWRYTYYNANTGGESNPSPLMIKSNWLLPYRRAVRVQYAQPQDSQVTHVRIYRRGGSITSSWYMLDQIPVDSGATTSTYVDVLSDASIVAANQLALDNDPPVTSTIPVAIQGTVGTVITPDISGTYPPAISSFTPTGITSTLIPNQIATVGTNDNEETVSIVSYDSITGIAQAYFQYAHPASDEFYVSDIVGMPVNLAVSAFERIWLAGDPNNPHLLYYSKVQQPEAFPPQNTLEVGTPDAPIMAMCELGGQLYAFTTKAPYMIWGGSATPTPLPTYARHGLVASFGITSGNGLIWKRSQDGLYTFRNSADQKASEVVDWILNGKNYGPVKVADPTQKAADVMAWKDQSLYYAYTASDGSRNRLIWEDNYKRWRNDSLAAVAMLYELDTGNIIFSTPDGMIYQDRVGDGDFVNNAGTIVSRGIQFDVSTGLFDQGMYENPKSYQSVTLTADTGGQDVQVYALYDNGQTQVLLGTINCTGRTQNQLPPINGGMGQVSYNIGLRFTASATSPIFIYEASVHACPEPDRNKSFDSFWLRYGTDEFKVIKQGWFEYRTYGADVAVKMFRDGSDANPYTFTLPNTNGARKIVRVRFDAAFAKANSYRWVMTSAQDFQLYGDSHIELKPVSIYKGYQKVGLLTQP